MTTAPPIKTNMLTPEEIEALRKDMRESLRRMHQIHLAEKQNREADEKPS